LSISDLAYPEVQYVRTGLKTVVCQVKFDPLLKIGQEAPADFQDQVRQLFPKFSREEGFAFHILPPGAPVEALPGTRSTVWRFKTEDEAWTAGLAIEFLSLETTQYEHFQHFESRFSILENALRSVYSIDHYVRLGLRYINIFTPDQFPGGWRHRFNPQLLGPMVDSVLGDQVAESRQALVLREGDSTITVIHGTENGNYRLDIDHAIEVHVDLGSVPERLRGLNRRIYQVFRWAISDALHQEMGGESRD